MIVIIAEKPSVGKDIARVLGVKDSKKGYMEGNGYAITWAFGHLVTLAMPEDYRTERYSKQDLPILPTPFKFTPRKVKGKYKYDPDPAALAQLKLIKQLLDKCDSIIVATDAGREGELIFRNIYNYLECTKPFSRLWISSLTDSAISDGLANLKDGKQYDSLYLAAEARSKADWMVGVNASRALSVSLGDSNNSLGRVQTPTLAMICKRYSEHVNFKAEPFWEMLINIASQDVFYIKSTIQYFDKAEADKTFSLLKEQDTAIVKKVEKTERIEQPPLLHDLASLQKAANTKYGYSADKTLSIAQRLYELKYITYPRTGSRYIPDDIFMTIPDLLKQMQEYPGYNTQSSSLAQSDNLNKKSVNASKVTDHHAILVTGILPVGLDEMETNIYELIYGGLLQAFHYPCIKDATTILIDCGGIEFRANGWTMKQEGWRSVSVCNKQEEKDEDNRQLPTFQEGEILMVHNSNMIQKKTKAKPLFTEATLLTAMETAGKEIEDEQAKEALKDLGIGTAATRAAIIETLLTREYIVRQKKNIVPTPKGMQIHKAIKGMRISDVDMTGQWELAIEKIIRQPEYYDTFLEGMKVHARQLTDEILNMPVMGDKTEDSPFLCPKCKLGRLVFYPKIIRCNNNACKHIIYRQKCDVTLTDEHLYLLFRKGRTGLIKGFKNKMGKTFDAIIVLDEEFNLKFDFSADKGKRHANKK